MRGRTLVAGVWFCLAASALAAERDVMLVLDNSGSMRRNDPARLTSPAVQQFIERQTPGTRVGVVLFAEHPRLALPLTPVGAETRGAFLAALDGLDYTGKWTQTAGGVERGLYELKVAGRPGAERALILMTDGLIDTGVAARDLELQTWLRDSLTEQARRDRVRIFGIAFTEQADYLLLQALALRTDADYFRAPAPGDIGAVLARIETVMLRPAERISEAAPAGAEASGSVPRSLPVAAAPVQDAPAVAKPAEASGFDLWGALVSLLRLLGVVLVLALLAAAAWAGWQRRGRWRDLLARFRPAERAPAQPRAVLYDVYDPSDIRRHEVGERPVVIGRVSGSDPAMDYVVVDERTVGRWHATVERRGQAFWIRDEGSVNGTFVNDQRITGEHPLKHGDMVRVHRHEFEFVIPDLFDSDRTMLAAGAPAKPRAAAGEEARA